MWWYHRRLCHQVGAESNNIYHLNGAQIRKSGGAGYLIWKNMLNWYNNEGQWV